MQATQPDLIQPAAEIAFPNTGFVQAAFGRDSDTLIVQTTENAINLFGLAVYFWPEFLGGLTFLLVAWTLLRCWRAARTPRLVGQPHCRRCNYCLTGTTEDRCPECGTPPSKRRPIIGRSLARRIGSQLTVASIAVLAYTALFAWQVPRVGAVSKLLPIWSTAWYQTALQGKKANFLDRLILKLGGPTIRIAEYDAATGQERRLIGRLPGIAVDECFAFHSTDEVIWSATFTQNRLCALSARNGALLRDFALPPGVQPGGQWQRIAGILPDGKTAIAAIHDRARQRSLIVAANRITGTCKMLFETGVSESYQSPGKFFLVPGSEHIRLIEQRYVFTPTTNPTNNWRVSTTLFLYEVRDSGVVSHEFPHCFPAHSAPAFTPDGRFMFAAATFDPARPVRWNLESRWPVDYQQAPPGQPDSDWRSTRLESSEARTLARGMVDEVIYGDIAYSPTRERIYTLVSPPARAGKFQIAGYREDTDQWLAAVGYPFQIRPKAILLSLDGRRLLVHTHPPQPGPNESRLMVYDLP